MADTRFFTLGEAIPLGELAHRTGAKLAPDVDPEQLVEDVAPLEVAGPSQISFLDNTKYLPAFEKTKAGACFVHPKLAERAPKGVALLLTEQPYHAYALAAQAFYPKELRGENMFGEHGLIHPRAIVHETAKLGENVTIEPGAVIGAGAEIGSNTVICCNASIGKGCTVGKDSYIGPNASVSHAHIGDGVMIHAGVRIGQDGFGFAMGYPKHEKVPQLGRVIIQDNAEIGANTTIDRGAGPDTVIGEGTKIDNLVQIGHNVEIGRGCIVVAQTGVAGSAKLGDFVVLAAQVGVTGHLTINSGAQIAARGAVVHDVPAGQQYGGAPAKPIAEWRREIVELRRLGRGKRRTANSSKE